MSNSIVADVEFHSDKNCFVLLDSNALGPSDYDELRYFEIRHVDYDESSPTYVAGRMIRSSGGYQRTDRSRLLINGVFANRLRLKQDDRVWISLAKEPKACFAVVAEPASPDDWEVVLHNAEKIEEQLLVQLRLVYVGMEFPIWIDGGYCLFLRLVSCDTGGAPYGLLMEDTEITVTPKVSVKDSTASSGPQRPKTGGDPSSTEIDQEASISLLLRGVGFFDAILDKLHRYATMVLSDKDPIFIGHPLILGAPGAGKTMMAKAFCQELRNRSVAAHTSIIECKLLRGKAVESVEKRLKDKIASAVDSQPALIVLDDLDSLCASGSTMEQITPGISMLYERMSRMLGHLIKDLRHDRRRFLFLATATSIKSLNTYLIAPRGVRYFDTVAEIPELDYEARKASVLRLLAYGMPDTTAENERLKSIATWAGKRTEGYVMADLAAVVERALIAFESRSGSSDESCLTMEDFKKALDGFVPTAMSGVTKGGSNQKDAKASFDTIGGMEEAKALLEKLLLLPTKYPKIFATLPIRLPRGLILYGPSGCGKTLLAAAVAYDYKLNFIHIKGAELLSKYIGASEQGVRDTFQRAKSMKPCLVFFDEFDALAPRRGHDSTGVTDRVVNQLLTELDGVESLEGVFVLAASSRPDLIDPALLRPGRIDKRVFCGLPTEAERLDILTRLSKPLSVDSDVDFVAVAKRTESFSGADLKSVLLDAHMLAMKEAMSGIRDIGNIRIMQRHVDHVLDSIKPSVSAQERQRYDDMYRNFQGDLDEAAVMKFYQENVGNRATLA